MFRTINLLTWIFITLTLLVSPVWAQFGASVDASGGYDSNIFQNYKNLSDYYRSIEGYLNYDWYLSSQGVRAFYQGSGRFFQKYTAFTY